MPSKALRALEVWTDLRCNSGTRLSVFTQVVEARIRTSLAGRERATFVVPRQAAAFDDLVEGRVVSPALEDGTWSEWRIMSIEDGLAEDGALLATVEAEGIRYDLRRRAGLLERIEADGFADLDWQLNDLSADDWVDEFLAAPDVPSYFVKGTIQSAPDLTVPIDGDDPLAGFEKLASLGDLELDVRRNGTTDYRVDLLNERGSSAAKVLIATKRNLREIAHVSDIIDSATRVYPRGGGGQGFRGTMAEHRWSVSSVSADDVTLSSSPIAPISFDDQLNDLYMEEPDGTTRNQVTDTVQSTQTVTVPGHTVTAGDEVVFRRNAAGDDLTYLERPASKSNLGLVVRVLDRPDIPRVDNLVVDPYFEDWTASTLDQWTATGLTTTQNTTNQSFIKRGTSSAKLVSDAAGQTLHQDITVSPKPDDPFFTAQVELLIESGEWKVRLSDQTNTVTYPAADSLKARSAQQNRWLEYRIQPGENFDDAGTTTLRVTIESVQPGTCYVDAAQVTQTNSPAQQFFDGRAGNRLWDAANTFLENDGVAVQRYTLSVEDLHRLSTTEFANDQLVIGGTVIVKQSDLGIALETRIVELDENLIRPGETRVTLSENRRDLTGQLGRRGSTTLDALTSSNAATSPDSASQGTLSADDVQFTGDPSSPTVGSLQPAQSGADVTGQNTAADVVAVSGEIASDVASATIRALDAITNVGDLSANVLQVDGTDQLVLVKGKQGGAAADGDAVTFSPAFQNVPTVIFRPQGAYWKPEFSGLGTGSVWDGAGDIDVGSTDAGPHTEAHTVDSQSSSGIYVIGGLITTSSNSGTPSEATLTVEVDFRGTGTWAQQGPSQKLAVASGTAVTDQAFAFPVHIPYAVAGTTQVRLKLVRDSTSGTWEITVAPDTFYEDPFGGVGELFRKTVPNGLDASGFTLVAKIVERDITTAAETDAFPAGTLTGNQSGDGVGGTHALGGLSADAFDDTYTITYDGSLTIDSADDTSTVTDSFPAGTLTSQGASKEVTLSKQTNDDAYDVQYDVDLRATADGNTGTSDADGGTLTAVGNTSSGANLSRNPSTGAFTTYFDITQNTGDVEVAVESNDGGAGWVEETSATYLSPTVGLQSLSWTNGALAKNDDVRIKVKSGSGSFSVDAVKHDYNAHFLKIDATVVVEVDKGAGWEQKDSTLYSVTDEDGVENTNQQTNVIKSFTDAALDKGEKARVRLSALTVTGTGTKTHSIDPDHTRYTTGTIETASVTVTLAVDAKDGAGSWVEKDTRLHTVQDSSGTGTTLTLTDETMAFTDSAIDTSDDIRMRVKAVSTSGSFDSWSYSIDPQDVTYTSESGTTTEHSQTPRTGDEINWIAVAG